ncbi:hypothetical protein [Rhodoligotrophos defluvii]|uniref:hypothetical protein n=1 Tax=Rhodoligotrophos defluvii TaxID=2561934 RepID=UPI0010C9B0BA|nr:hypothetical protein [Rhodoligotrophos defluvii]
MSIYPGAIRTRQNIPFSEIEAPLSDTLGASFQGAWRDTFYGSASRWLELDQAQRGDVEIGIGGITRQPPRSPLLTADQAKARVREAGIEGFVTLPDTDIREEALSIMIDRAKARRKTEATIARGPSGLMPGALRLGTAFAANVLDPVGVAASFIPVVGQARYAALLAKAGGAFGRAGVRVGVGAVEGAAGAALLEPMTYLANTQEGQDYTMADAVLNIAVGSVVGGGLHVGAGIAGDLWRNSRWATAKPMGETGRLIDDLPPEAREALLRPAVAQLASGRHVEIEPVFRSEFVPTRRSDLLQSTALATGTVDLAPPEMRFGLEAGPVDRLQAAARISAPEVFARADELDLAIREREERLASLERPADGREAQRTARTGAEQPAASLPRSARDEPTAAAAGTAMPAGRDTDTETIRAEIETLRSERLNLQPEIDRATRQAFTQSAASPLELARRAQAAAQRTWSPEAVRVADFRAAEQAAEKLTQPPAASPADEVSAELEEALTLLNDVARPFGGEQLVAGELEHFDEIIAAAEAYGRAARAAALCGLRR